MLGTVHGRYGPRMTSRLDDLPRVPIDSRAQWRAWLQRHHAASGSIWLAAPAARNERANQWKPR